MKIMNHNIRQWRIVFQAEFFTGERLGYASNRVQKNAILQCQK